MSDDNQEAEIVKKLDKVAGSLETTTSQLSSVVTQQQLDLIRERLAKVESDFSSFSEQNDQSSERLAGEIQENISSLESLKLSHEALERDHTALRALTFSSFILSTVSIIGLVICAIYL